jgi:hypothetical protein
MQMPKIYLYKCLGCKKISLVFEKPSACKKCGKTGMIQIIINAELITKPND